MRVLIGCEFSGVVREAFRALGHDAWSCDLLPAEDGSKFHYQCDIFDLIRNGRKKWDKLIFHWPCTLLCNSGVRWLYGGKGAVISQPRFYAMKESARNFYGLLNCYIPKIAGENPIPHKFAREIMGDYSQLIQPYQFGHGETKATCLWLKNLPPLIPTDIVTGRVARVHLEPPGPDRWKNRSRTMPGIAKAMAEQWGPL